MDNMKGSSWGGKHLINPHHPASLIYWEDLNHSQTTNSCYKKTAHHYAVDERDANGRPSTAEVLLVLLCLSGYGRK